MDGSTRYVSGRFQNMFQTAVILSSMVALFGLLGWAMFGNAGLLWALLIAGFILAGTPRLSPMIILRVYGARPLSEGDAAGLYRIVSELSRRAGLDRSPRLFYVPSRVSNAFSVGSVENSAIALSDGLIRLLNTRELMGVLAHEISHIANNDLYLHALADIMTRVTSLLSFFGQVLVIFYLPVIFFSDAEIPWFFILVLLAAPIVSVLLQLALSRTREFDADLSAVRLTSDPKGLASAMLKMERYDRRAWEVLLTPGRRDPHPSLLRTHPHISERVRRIMQLDEGNGRDIPGQPERIVLPDRFPEVFRPPRWNWLRPWH